jgi:hypothetical protein
MRGQVLARLPAGPSARLPVCRFHAVGGKTARPRVSSTRSHSSYAQHDFSSEAETVAVDLRKVVAVGVSAGALGLQLWAIMPPLRGGREWYWPFIDYPMYSKAFYASDTFTLRELRLVPCDKSRPSKVATWQDVGILPSRFRRMLAAVARPRTEPSDAAYVATTESALENGIAARLPAMYCEAQVWEKAVRNDGNVSIALQAPWTRAHVWNLANSGVRHTAGSGAATRP